MEFWGAEIKDGVSLKVQPGKGKMLHLSQACLGEIKKDKVKDYIRLYVQMNGQKFVAAVLSLDRNPHVNLDLIFEDEFELSHDLKQGSLHIVGYKVDDPDTSIVEDESDDDLEELVPIESLNNGRPEAKDLTPSGSTASAGVKPEKAKDKSKVKIVEPSKDAKKNVEDDNTEDDDEDDESAEDEEMASSDAGSDEEGDSDEEDNSDDSDETPKKLEPAKKRPGESTSKTPVLEKKAKFSTPQQKTETALNMLSPDKTLARSATQIRKENAEKKKAQLAAKGQDGKGAPRSINKLLKRKPDQSPRLPDVQQFSKTMLRSISKEDKEAIPGIQAFNVDRTLSLLSEAMLRVDGLNKSYARKQEEAEAVKRLTAELAKANQSKSHLEAALESAQADLKALEGADRENTTLRVDVNRLKDEMDAARTNFKATLKAEQIRLIEENEHDCWERMKIAWEALQLGSPYEIWALAYEYAEQVLFAREEGRPELEPFEDWAEKHTSDGEEEEEEQQQPPPEDGAPGAPPQQD